MGGKSSKEQEKKREVKSTPKDSQPKTVSTQEKEPVQQVEPTSTQQEVPKNEPPQQEEEKTAPVTEL